MASEPEKVEGLQSSILLKIGDKTPGEHLEALDPKDIFNSKAGFCYCYSATAYFRDRLIGQPVYILDSLYQDEAIKRWLLKAVNFLSTLLLDPFIFNSQLQQKMQPLIDLLYYFNKADATIKSILCGFEVIKAIPHLKKQAGSKSIQEIFEKNYEKSFGIGIDSIFNDENLPISETIGVLFRNYTRLDTDTPVSKLEQAYYAARLISNLKKHPNFAALSAKQQDKLKRYLEVLQNNYFSLRHDNKFYYRDNADNIKSYNTAVKQLFENTKALIDRRLENINKRDQQVDLKALFLKLFTPDLKLPFFSSPSYTIIKTKEIYVDWHHILALLSVEIKTSSLDINSKADLSRHITSFVEAQQQAAALVVPEISDLDQPAEKMGCLPESPLKRSLSGPSSRRSSPSELSTVIRSSSGPSSFNKQ